MNIIADENIYEPIIEFLKSEGHNVLSVRNSELSGNSDDDIYKVAVKNKLLIITMDKDFTRTLRFPPEQCGGIIVIQLYRMTVNDATETFKKLFKSMNQKKISNRLVIITKDEVRISPLSKTNVQK